MEMIWKRLILVLLTYTLASYRIETLRKAYFEKFKYSKLILPNDKTTYYDQVFAVPKELKQKRHILKVRLKLNFINSALNLNSVNYKWELILPKYNFERMHHLDT